MLGAYRVASNRRPVCINDGSEVDVADDLRLEAGD